MQQLYTTARATWARIITGSAGLLLLAGLTATPATAQQLNYDYLNGQNLAGAYQDLGTTGTAIAVANADDANSAAQPIGFSFGFNGQTFTQFVLNTNGFVKLGSVAPTSAANFLQYAQTATVNGQTVFPGGPIGGSDTTMVNVLAPFATDLAAAASGGAEFRVATTGTAPNRMCTIQWKNVHDKPRRAAAADTTIVGTQYESFSFQVKLYETSGQIDFVYGAATAGSGTDNFRTAVVAIKGRSAQAGNLLTVNKGSTGLWSVAKFYSTSTWLNVRRSVLPDAGRTFRFRANATQDAAVNAVFTLGQLPVGTPHAVRASIRNVGTQTLLNLPVRLDVNGPGRPSGSAGTTAFTFNNTQTIASLAPGASTVVTFAAYTAGTHLGTNTIMVSLPTDAYPDGNVGSEPQVQTNNSYNYGPPAVATSGLAIGYYGFDTRPGITAVKYNAPRATTLLSVTDFMPADGNSTGQTIYAVALDVNGNILARTVDYNVRAGDLGNTVTFTFATPVALPAGDFMVGIAQLGSPVAHYPVGRLFESNPRPGSFYDRSTVTSGAFNDVSTRGFGPFLIGANTTNSVLAATEAAPAVVFGLLPNPAHDAAQLQLATAAPTAQAVQVLDVLGRAVRTLTLAAGATRASLPVADLPRGLYLVRVGATTQRLVLE
ncbi:T9SS type A sorting domain-containing protein [Hymenobacter sp. DH14]|uniref:T9SS type A sorting domain-containing protein n=1 Tax=Hymenobacter cyanobacteriorum TaxID=2926463 RepID=A0A9X1VK27_9BACT|nr:T9SS type A sorting domain-containing protein [Hymenobacter cyanobacteriorum]MCI1188450.1 T9SS type A sorting domain-containing protein [Hymenobacter cyanobacteriorum]